jgi:Ca-activated chloride channel family protein
MKTIKFAIPLVFLFLGTAFAGTPAIRILAHDHFGDEEEGQPKNIELEITDLKLDIDIYGSVVESSVTMTLYNPTEMTLEADLHFPMPAHSAVSGYALDVEGVMIDGVIVEKKKARKTYESIVKQGIDPGLLEVGENIFHTRIFPLDEFKSRTVRVTFTTNLADGGGFSNFHLPLNFPDKIKQVSFNISALDMGRKPKFGSRSVFDIGLKLKNGKYVGHRAWRDVKVSGDLMIDIPAMENQAFTLKNKNDEYFFLINDVPPAHVPSARPLPKRLAILWDASGSRQFSNLGKELELLAQYVERFKGKSVKLDLVIFRNELERVITFNLPEERPQFFKTLKDVQYDGATNLGSIDGYRPEHAPDLYLLFADGKENFGRGNAAALGAPVFAISSASNVNAGYLQYLARTSGGEYYDLMNHAVADLAPLLGAAAYQFLSAEVEPRDAATVLPEMPESVHGLFQVVGRLNAPAAKITLNYGVDGRILHRKTYSLSRKGAVQAGVADYLWATQKIKSLQISAQPDKQKIIEVSKQYGVATVYTDLLVLEDAEQYVEYKIEPPASMPKWVSYYERYSEDKYGERETRKEKLDRVAERWKELKEWWSTDFSARKYAQKPYGNNYIGGCGDAECVEVVGIRGSLEEIPEDGKINIRPWTPERPYLQALEKAQQQDRYAEYLRQRAEYESLPAFYIESADFFHRHNERTLALRILSNLAEISSDDYAFLRILGYKLAEYAEHGLAIEVFRQVLEMNPEEPQPYRDLALALSERAQQLSTKPGSTVAAGDYEEAIGLLYKVVTGSWDDRFEDIELIVLMEMNRIIAKSKYTGLKKLGIDPRLTGLLDVDIRIVVGWHADDTDMDLWVIQPDGEKADYSNQETAIGGHVSNDMTQGFGPEEYMLRKALKGKYKISVHYYGSDSLIPTGTVKVRADVFLNYGRANEQHKVLTVELEKNPEEEEYVVGEIEF